MCVVSIQAPPATGLATFAGSIFLNASRLYDIKIEYRENTGIAGIQLYWSSPSQSYSLVPSDRLFYDQSAEVVGSPYTYVCCVCS